MSHIENTVDGVSLQGSQMPRVQSPLFNLTFATNNVVGTTASPTQSVSDGYYVFLHPLSPGKHEIGFKAAQVQFTTTGVSNEAQNIVYHVTVHLNTPICWLFIIYVLSAKSGQNKGNSLICRIRDPMLSSEVLRMESQIYVE